jgi:sugar phosphate isomerase/epimerase
MSSRTTIKSAVTVSLVKEARQGPFVYHEGLEDGLARAAALKFDAVEIFAPSAADVDPAELRRLLTKHRLEIAAFGTGAGWLVQKLTLTSPDPQIRLAARRYIAAIIDLAGGFGAPAIIGSMQGRIEPSHSREQAMAWLKESLTDLSSQAASYGVPLLLEPLNRYETNVFNRLTQTAEFLNSLGSHNVKLLADLFHMNIEESDIFSALRSSASLIGHVHLADSNRHAFGFGHTDFTKVKSALREMNFCGYLSAEILPLPDADAAAKQTLAAIRNLTS